MRFHYFGFWLHLAAKTNTLQDLVPQPGTEVVAPQWKHRVLTTGPPGKSLSPIILKLGMCME